MSAALRKNAAALAAAARRAARGDAGGIHRLRVSTRRLREALELVPGHDALTRDLRRLGKAFGPVRELDVARKVLAESAERESWPASVVSRVDEWCANARDRKFEDARVVLDACEPKEMSSRLRGVAAAADREIRPRSVAAHLRQAARDVVGAIDAAGTVYAPSALHEVRIAAKKLRYRVELAGEPTPGTLRRLRTVQTVLGSMHDLQVLQRFVQEVATDARDLGEMATLGAMARTIDATCRGWHGKALRLLPGVRALARGLAARVIRPRDLAQPARMTRMAGTQNSGRARRRRIA